MKKRMFRLLGLVCAFGILLGGYALVSHFTSQDDTDTESAETVTVAAVEADDVVSLRWTYEDETLSLTKADNGGWINEDSEDMPIDADKVDNMLSALSSIVSTRSIEDPQTLSDYGLDPGVCDINIGLEDGSTLAFSIGDYNSVSSCYYMLYEDTVYLVDDTLLSAYSVTEQDLLAYESIPDISDTQSITISSGDNILSLRYLDSDMEAYSYTDAYTWFLEENDSYTPLSSSAAQTLKSSISDMEFLSCAAWDADENALSEYGLNQPAGQVTVSYLEDTNDEDSDAEAEEATVTLLFGSYTDDDGCYVMLEGSTMVYTIDATTADTLLLATRQSLLPTDICLVAEDIVERMDITMDGITSTITMTHETQEDEDAETTTTSYLGDTELNPDEIDNMFLLLQSLSSQGDADSSLGQREPVLTITFQLNNENFPELTLSFSTYDSTSYLVTFQEESRMLCSKSDVRDLMDQIETALASEPEEDSTADSSEE